MELEEMKAAWAEMERRLETAETTTRGLIEQKRADTVRRTVRGIGWGQFLEILIWIAVIFVVAPFWIANRDSLGLLLSGLIIHVYAIAAICSGVVQVLLVLRISYATPVVDMQAQLLELRRFRIRAGLLLSLPWWVLWVLSLAVIVKAASGVDLYEVVPGWMAANLAFGVVGMAVTVLLARRKGKHTGRFFASLADDMAGHRLTRTLKEMAEVEAFARG